MGDREHTVTLYPKLPGHMHEEGVWQSSSNCSSLRVNVREGQSMGTYGSLKKKVFEMEHRI